MKTKKIYNAPKLEIVDIDSTPILAGSDPNGSTIPGGTTGAGDPCGSAAQSALGTSEYFDTWVSEDE